MAGMRVVVVASTSDGNIDVDDLRAKAEEHRDRLAALMVTYPSARTACSRTASRRSAPIVHEHGGQVYMDGANMNAQVGPDEPGGDRRRRLPPEPAQDVQHPARRRRPGHGADRRGGAPRAVPAGHPVDTTGGGGAIHAVSAAPWGSASILLISYGYIRMLGARRHDRRDALRDPERQLHQGAARTALSGALHAAERPRRARDDLRPAAVQAGERRSTRRTSRSG